MPVRVAPELMMRANEDRGDVGRVMESGGGNDVEEAVVAMSPNLVATPSEMHNWLFIYRDVNGGEMGNLGETRLYLKCSFSYELFSCPTLCCWLICGDIGDPQARHIFYGRSCKLCFCPAFYCWPIHDDTGDLHIDIDI